MVYIYVLKCNSCHASYLLLNTKNGVAMMSCMWGDIKHSHGASGCLSSHAFVSPPSPPNVRFCMP